MMLFRPEHVPMILAGTKTQTRRLWAKCRVKVGSLQKCYSGGLPISKCPMCEGCGEVRQDYIAGETSPVPCPVCHGTGHLQPFAIVRVLRVWQERLLDISEEDARAEGYANRVEYLEAFGRINKVNAIQMRNLVVWCIEFELVEAPR